MGTYCAVVAGTPRAADGTQHHLQATLQRGHHVPTPRSTCRRAVTKQSLFVEPFLSRAYPGVVAHKGGGGGGEGSMVQHCGTAHFDLRTRQGTAWWWAGRPAARKADCSRLGPPTQTCERGKYGMVVGRAGGSERTIAAGWGRPPRPAMCKQGRARLRAGKPPLCRRWGPLLAGLQAEQTVLSSWPSSWVGSAGWGAGRSGRGRAHERGAAQRHGWNDRPCRHSVHRPVQA